MYIKNILIENIRGFSKLDFDLSRPDGKFAGWTVFTGDNGSGKSTLLKAISIALVGKDTARALQPSFRRWISDGASGNESYIQLEMVRVENDDELRESGKSPSDEFPAKITLRNGGKEPSFDVAIPKSKAKNYQTPSRTIWSMEAAGWFSCGYGPFRRIFGESPEAAMRMAAPTTEKYVTMFQEAASLAGADQWLRNLHHKSLENRSLERDQLSLVVDLLRDGLLPNQIDVERVDSDGLWLRDRNGVQLAWSEMSDGYRAAAALLADIVRHLINAYGLSGLSEKAPDGKTVIKRSGVVLIDEIDAHLHPEWQQVIGFWLKRHFPNIQFLVTTHSPLICQAADEKGIFVLPEPGEDKRPFQLGEDDYRKVIASRPDTILLTPAFGLRNTRSQFAVERRAEYSDFQAKRRSGATLTNEEQLSFDSVRKYINEEEGN